MNLTEAERLVRRIELYLKQPDAAMEPDVMAAKYAAEHGATVKRLVTCQRILRGGDRAQALQLAETPPAVLDLINCLEFRKARDWVSLCRQNGWKAPEPVDREAVHAVQEAYAEGVEGDHDFFRKYRGAVLRRNWPAAYEALQSILKVQPNDEGYHKEAGRLRKQILDGLMKPLGEAVNDADLQEVFRLTGEIEALPFVAFEADAGNATWARAQCMRCDQLLGQAQQRRDGGQWRGVLELTGRVRDLIIQYGFALPAEQENELSSLSGWAAAEKQEHEEQQKHDSLVGEELHLLQKAEERQTARTNPTLPEQKEELETLSRKWRELEQTGRSVPEELQDRFERNTALLRGQVSRSQRIRRNAMLAGAMAVLVVLAVAGFFIMEARNAGAMAADLEALIKARKVGAAESLAKGIREKHPRLVGYAKVTAALGQVPDFCSKEREASTNALTRIAGLAKRAENGFEDQPIQDTQSEIDACGTDVKNLAEEFQNDAGSNLAAVRNEWELHLDTLGGRRNTEFSALLAGAQQEVTTIPFDLAPAKAAEALGRLAKPIEQMRELLPARLSLMKIREASVREFGALTNRVGAIRRELNAWESGLAAMRGAEGMEAYLSGVGTIRGSKFATPRQEETLSRLLSAELKRDKLMQVLLMPGRDAMWKRFTNNQSLQPSPAVLMPSEARILVELFRDRNLNGVKLGRIREIEFVDLNPVEKPWQPVFVFGGLGSRSISSLSNARAGGAEVEVVPSVGKATARMEWAVIYDPGKFPDKVTREYRNLRPTKWKFEFVTEEGSATAVSPPELHLLNRINLSELLTGGGDTMAGQYVAAGGEGSGLLTIHDNGRCSLVGDDFHGGHGRWRREGVALELNLFDPEKNRTTRYSMDWMGNAVLAHAVHGRSDFVEKFLEMSVEMLTFARRGTDGGYVTAPVRIARVMDTVIADEDVAPLFKLFMLNRLQQITSVRPGEWDTAWLPEGVADKLGKELNIPEIEDNSGNWMIPVLRDQLGKTVFEETLAEYKTISLEVTAELAHEMIRKPFETGFSLVGFVELDHEGSEQLYLTNPSTKRLWGWDATGKPGKLYEWDPENNRHKANVNAMPFGPVYEFNGDAAAMKTALLEGNKTGFPDKTVEKWLPPLYR